MMKIESEEDLDRAIGEIDRLLVLDRRDPDQETYLDALTDIVETYESEHHPIKQAPAEDVLRLLMESNGINQARLAIDTGISQSTISEILSGKRSLNRRHIGILCRHFKVSPAVFFD